ncbi:MULTISPECIES: CHAD domain-containing protein [unclassified Novosphingobium]|uniref:CYTH and CHAD domain-containing protein n=1 Tax=unclassified Novosphingobium TaxID=2644732 RepID=UPI00135688D4|nr:MULTISPECIES: CHAD domain-containing protein [unclassified Novosphingobium]
MSPDSVEVEVELKLELSPEGADTLEASGLFPGTAKAIRQYAIYFDTPDHDLARSGLSLRIRRSGDQRVQTVKASGGAAGMFIRPEWECDVADDEPIIDHSTPISALLGDKVAAIAPLFVVENERRIWDDAGIEVALDRSRIIAGDRESSVFEVELERKSGDPATLFALARNIDAVTPVHLAVLSKAERGYRLLGPIPSRSKAAPIKLNATMTAATAFQTIAYACLQHFRLNVPLVLDQRDAKALHQTRVALRRLRSALAIFRDMLTDGHTARFNKGLRWLAGELGMARELDVLIEQAGDSAIQPHLLPARTQAYDDAITALRSNRARALMLDIVEWIALGEWLSLEGNSDLRQMQSRSFADGALQRFRRKVKKDGRNLEKLEDEARHKVRKAAKKLRYATEFFAALYGEKREKRRLKRFVSALEALQDRLGLLNDRAGTPKLLASLALADQPGAADLIGKGHDGGLLEAAAEDYDTFVDAKRFWR